ncbi:MAG: FMN reductase, partial [Mesorhizobium sp.]
QAVDEVGFVLANRSAGRIAAE